MPAKSKAQFRFMKAVESGNAKAPGMSKKEAHEYTAGQSSKGLPEKMPKSHAEMPPKKHAMAMKKMMTEKRKKGG